MHFHVCTESFMQIHYQFKKTKSVQQNSHNLVSTRYLTFTEKLDFVKITNIG
jgi:phage-related protein